jgi:hypothetical protein
MLSPVPALQASCICTAELQHLSSSGSLSPRAPLQIAKLKEIEEVPGKDDYSLKCTWYYRPKETYCGPQASAHPAAARQHVCCRTAMLHALGASQPV